ncbi:hypothetical protein IAR55_001406 [Kwoniella newhampshirensis]|uniref:NADP-dependent oxidoreductase domain-containing protein n=1 Tax=Kwoniella newhampshirensis TaxID=1651941 RepID=A0AAW0Z223_9TREE
MTSPIPTVTVAGNKVGRVGYGLMQLTWNPKAPSEEISFAAIKAAADAGSTIWSSAAFYGNPGDNFANLRLIKNFFAKYPEYKDKITLVIKGGGDYKTLQPRGDDIEFLRTEIKAIKEYLGDKEIDVYNLARLPHAPVEDVFKNLVTLQKEGLFREIGASEMGVESLKKALKVTPIAINEIEVSLFSISDPSIKAAVDFSAEVGLPTFAYSPLGRGFLTRSFKSPDDLPAGDFRKMVPRFQGEAFYENLKLVDKLDEIAKNKGVQTSQLALAWVLQLSPYMIPIPGSSNPERVRENIASANITLTPEELKTINDILAKFEPKGARYPEFAMPHLVSTARRIGRTIFRHNTD